jgi:hypothetical protein
MIDIKTLQEGSLLRNLINLIIVCQIKTSTFHIMRA